MSKSKGSIIKKCEELIQGFNPITHSIDTYCLENLGDVSAPGASEDNIFIQQVVYGWQKQKPALECFLNNFYGDNSSRILRTDRTLYTIFAYIAIFRLDELGFNSFKGYILSQDPQKMVHFITYLFNSDNLSSCLRADWMKLFDLSYVEDEIVAGIELFLPQAVALNLELQEKALGVAAALAAKEEARKAGTLGLGKSVKKESTRPQSPNITQPRPPRIPEPHRIDQGVIVKDVPTYLDKTSIKDIQNMRKQALEESRKHHQSKYDESMLFKINETKHARDIEEIKREVEEARMKDVDFNKSFYKKPPDFKSKPANIRLNAAAILREDALYKKLQAKDAQVLKAYEEDLRDSSEYYAWLSDMKTRDEEIKLKQVALRREQTKQSDAQAKLAIERQHEDNNAIANLMREQAEAIKQQRVLEEEIRSLEAQQRVNKIMEAHLQAPKGAKDKILQEREEQALKLREELEEARKMKEEQDIREAEIRADKIRELKAINSIPRKNVVVFDPTESSGIGLLDEMSFMELKERMEAERLREEEAIAHKKQEIQEEKDKKAKEMQVRAQNIQQARHAKVAAKQAVLERKKEQEAKVAAAQAAAKEAAAVTLDDELDRRRELRRREQEAIKADADRVRRQQQYMGVAKAGVDEARAAQQLAGNEREASALQNKLKQEAEIKQRFSEQDSSNRSRAVKQEAVAKVAAAQKREKEAIQERRESIEKLKTAVVERKSMFGQGKQQAASMKATLAEHNPYAAKLSEDSRRTVRVRDIL